MEQKKLDRLVSYAELVSALVIILTLVYGVYEYKRGQTLTDADINKMIYDHSNEYVTVGLSNQILLEASLALEKQEPLSELQHISYRLWRSKMLDAWEMSYDYYSQGILMEENWIAWNEFFALKMAIEPDWVWEELKGDYFFGDFSEYVDGEISRKKQELNNN